jgi:putative hydrolase of the HAD superfamily
MIASRGSDRGRIIDRALELLGITDVPVEPLVEAFRAFDADPLHPYSGVREALSWLRQRVPIAVVSDGDPVVQRVKLDALGLAGVFHAVVISDDFGRARRKPDPYSLLVAADKINVDPEGCIYVGDRPEKDVAAARAAGMRSVRVRTGEYASAPDLPGAWLVAQDLPTAIRAVAPLLPGPRVPGPLRPGPLRPDPLRKGRTARRKDDELTGDAGVVRPRAARALGGGGDGRSGSGPARR